MIALIATLKGCGQKLKMALCLSVIMIAFGLSSTALGQCDPNREKQLIDSLVLYENLKPAYRKAQAVIVSQSQTISVQSDSLVSNKISMKRQREEAKAEVYFEKKKSKKQGIRIGAVAVVLVEVLVKVFL